MCMKLRKCGVEIPTLSFCCALEEGCSIKVEKKTQPDCVPKSCFMRRAAHHLCRYCYHVMISLEFLNRGEKKTKQTAQWQRMTGSLGMLLQSALKEGEVQGKYHKSWCLSWFKPTRDGKRVWSRRSYLGQAEGIHGVATAQLEPT